MTTTTARRNRTVATSVVQPAEEEKIGTSELVARFLTGENGSSGDFHSMDNALYEKKTIIARRAPDGSILLPKTNVSNVDFNDQLIGRICATNVPYRRLEGFNSLNDPTHRSIELNNGQYDDFRAIARLFNFEYSDEDFAALDRAKAFNTRVTEFFGAIKKEEDDRIRTAEEKARRERARQAAIEWDSGDGRPNNRTVTGEGGGQRLRVVRAGQRGSDGRALRTDRVQTSTGHGLALATAKRVFDFASKYWHGGEQFWGGSASMRTGGSYSGYGVTVNDTTIHYGCQQVNRKEAERFADSMNWERAKPSA